MAAPADRKIVCATTVSGFARYESAGFPANMSAETMARQMAAARQMVRDNAHAQRTVKPCFPVAK